MCNGNAVVDCAGVCGGNAVADCAGTYNGVATNENGSCCTPGERDCRGGVTVTPLLIALRGAAVATRLWTVQAPAVAGHDRLCRRMRWWSNARLRRHLRGAATIDCAGVCGGGRVVDCAGLAVGRPRWTARGLVVVPH